jgi:hypothetical protein
MITTTFVPLSLSTLTNSCGALPDAILVQKARREICGKFVSVRYVGSMRSCQIARYRFRDILL